MSTRFTKIISILMLLLVSFQVVTAVNFSSASALGMSLATAITSASATATIPQLIFCGYETQVGDADCDGIVEQEDAQLIAQIVVGLVQAPLEICYFDVKRDGQITILDSLQAAQIAVGILPHKGSCAEVIANEFDPSNVVCNERTLPGDINNDGKVNYVDSLIIARISVGLVDAPSQICCFDVNSDGRLNVLDSLLIAQFEAGLISKLEKSCRDNGGENPSGNSINSGLEVDRIIFVDGEYIQKGQRLGIAMDLENNGPKDLQNVRFRLTIPELGISKSGRYFDLDKRDDELDTIYVEIPEDTQIGDYLVRLEVSNTKSDVRRIKHRYVTVTE